MRLEHWWYSIPLRLRSLFGRRRVEDELNEEFQFHVDSRIAQEIAAGKSPEEARRIAMAAMDGLSQRQEECRDARRVNLFDHLSRDIRFGLRSLRKTPAFTVTALLTLTLGIGVNAAIFSVINAVLLRPLPYPQPDRLVRLYESNTSLTDNRDSVSAPNFQDWRAQARSFSSMSALRGEAVTLSVAETPEFLYAQRISPTFLDTLEIRPGLGRAFASSDYTPGNDRVAIISYEFWTRLFASDRAAIGRTIRLNFEPYTVIGVMPPHFRTPLAIATGDSLDILLPLVFSQGELQNRGSHNLQVFGRMRPGVTPAQAQAEMTGIAEGLARIYSNNQGRAIRLFPLTDEIVGSYRGSLFLVFGASGVILLLACANLASALLARGVGQQHEIAVRVALGANRMSIVRQVLVQNLILSAAGCLCGVFAAYWAVRGLQLLAPAKLPRVSEVAVDGGTLIFAVAASLITGILFGLMPALQLSRSRPYDVMKGRGADARSGVLRSRNAVMVVQVTLSLVLLVGAGLLLKSFGRLRGTDPGFQTTRTLAMKLVLPRTRYPQPEQRLQFFENLASHVRELPGIEAAGYTNALPMRGGWGGSFQVENPEVPMGPDDDSDFQIVSPGYFEALRIRLLSGRLLQGSDTARSQPVVLINRAFAHRYWPTRNPIGQHIVKAHPEPYTIVGVVDDVRLAGPAKPANVEVYFAAAQSATLPAAPGDLAVRSAADPLASLKSISAKSGASIKTSRLRTYKRWTQSSRSPRRQPASRRFCWLCSPRLRCCLQRSGSTA